MYAILTIDGGSATLTVPTADIQTTALEITGATGPLVLPVLVPAGDHMAAGRLVLAPQATGAVVLAASPDPDWIPSYGALPQPRLCLPSAVQGATPEGGYSLGAQVDLEALQNELVAAFETGDIVTVEIVTAAGQGVAILNGASLPFVVIVPAGQP